jgi:hypothetical protein
MLSESTARLVEHTALLAAPHGRHKAGAAVIPAPPIQGVGPPRLPKNRCSAAENGVILRLSVPRRNRAKLQ